MVKICSLKYSENEDYFAQYNFELHDFQKWSINATINGHHVLACAPTGSGKSLCAEFAIDFFFKKGKKSIYCSPIKSLSNQKYYDFQQKFPNISVGLITGDIKLNPLADVLIMTTEILLNQLGACSPSSYSATCSPSSCSATCSFSDIGCVIFDEIHMIGDKDRGHVWENCILMLPPHIQMIGLSATLDNPEKFAAWIENRGIKENEKVKENDNDNKIVYLTKKLVRPVPLTHYSFITANTGIFKAIKDKDVHQQIRSLIDKPFIIQDADGLFNEQNYLNMNKMLKLFAANSVRVKRQHVLNQLSKHLVENEMLPALCFVFSIKKLEKYAEELTCPLLEFDSKVPYTIEHECEQILRKLPNYQEYLYLPEYVKLISLLQKGIAIHHSKMIPILREIVEILFSRGLIKMLFCTTSVAIGLNLPVKTSIFTDIYKHNGTEIAILQGHEYVQAAGRAGRLGIDTAGHVIHLNNLFSDTGIITYKTMLKGAPQVLESNFKISYNWLLSSIVSCETDYGLLAKKSMIQEDIDNKLTNYQLDINKVQTDIDRSVISLKHIKTPANVINDYIDLKSKLLASVNKKRKEFERAIGKLEDTYDIKNIVKDMNSYTNHNNKVLLMNKLTNEKTQLEQNLDTNIQIILKVLVNDCFISYNKPKFNIMLKGVVATHIREVHCLVFASLIVDKQFNTLCVKELIGVLSCFTNVKVSDEFKAAGPISKNKKVVEIIDTLNLMYKTYNDLEVCHLINTGTDYSIHFDLIDYLIQWTECETEQECKFVLQQIREEKGIFLGEFIKAILKINNIVTEMSSAYELLGDMEMLQKCKDVPQLLLKFVATNQSLYV